MGGVSGVLTLHKQYREILPSTLGILGTYSTLELGFALKQRNPTECVQ